MASDVSQWILDAVCRNESIQPSAQVILSSYVVDLDLRASPQKRGKRRLFNPQVSSALTRFREPRVLHLADIVAPKVKTPSADEEVRSH